MPGRSRSREPAGTGRLSAERVVDTALKLIAKRGLEGLTMRGLGQALGVEAMSLYHWFPAKEHLLDAIADRLIRTVALPPPPTAEGWRHWVTGVARAYRRMGLLHPRAFPLLAARRFHSPGAFVFIEANVAAHLSAGFDVRQAVRLTRSIGAFVNGMVMAEVAPPPLAERTEHVPPVELNLLDAETWAETMRCLRRPSLDGAFDHGLGLLLDGVG
jgi:AcrR family transcriptional regulator